MLYYQKNQINTETGMKLSAILHKSLKQKIVKLNKC